jgi:anti-sigma regulatory factor (Ser/Thr protein kinase)
VEVVNELTNVAVDEASQVAAARRAAKKLAESLGFCETQTEKAALVVTEAATNLLKHAGGGEILMQGSDLGMELLSIDHGPGISNLDEALRDGYSTSDSLGTGFGAMERSSSQLELYSTPGKGTVVAAVIRDQRKAAASPAIELAGISVPKPGEQECGDGWAATHTPTGVRILVVDGLGHGSLAASAARAAAKAFVEVADSRPAEIMRHLNTQLHHTRGAAAAVVNLDLKRQDAVFCGVGNISGVLNSSADVRHTVSMSGIVGFEARNLREFCYSWTPFSILILSSDGLRTRWELASYPGIKSKSSLLIAGVLYRDLRRKGDDVTIVVAKENESR